MSILAKCCYTRVCVFFALIVLLYLRKLVADTSPADPSPNTREGTLYSPPSIGGGWGF